MPPQRGSTGAPTSFNNRKPFKPPRPSGASTTSKNAGASRSKAKDKAPAAAIDISSGDSDDGAASDLDMSDIQNDNENENDQHLSDSDAEDFGAFRKNPKSQGSRPPTRVDPKPPTRVNPPPKAKAPAPRTSRAAIQEDDIPDGPPPIPQKLLVRLLHDGFEDPNTKIGKEAMAVVTKYIETFVRESIARAVLERQEAGDQSQSRSGGLASGFLQVEDLEKLGPQLILDF